MKSPFCTFSGGKPVGLLTPVLSFRKVLKFRLIAIGSSFFQILVNQRFRRSFGTISQTSFRLAEDMVYVNSNVTEISKIPKKFLPSIDPRFFRKDKVVNLVGTHTDDSCSGSFSVLNIFRRIRNVQEKLLIQYSVQWGQFFFQCKTANSFYSKTNDSRRVGTTAFSGSRFWGSSLCRANYFHDLSLAFFDPRN